MKKQIFIYADDRAVVVVASSKKAAVAYLGLFERRPASTLSAWLFPVHYDRAQQVLWYHDTRSRRCPDPFVDLLSEERIPAGAFDAIREEPATRPTRGPLLERRLAPDRFDARCAEARLGAHPPLADQVLAMPAAEQARFVERAREQRLRDDIVAGRHAAPPRVELPAPDAAIELPSLPLFRYSWVADPGGKDPGGEVVVEGDEITLRRPAQQPETLPLRDWLRGRCFGPTKTSGRARGYSLYAYARYALEKWLSTRLSPVQRSGLSRMPPDDPDLLELTLGLCTSLARPSATEVLHRLVGRRDEWLLEQAAWLLSWGRSSDVAYVAYAVLDAEDRPRARALGLDRALADVTASWFWGVVAQAIVDEAEGVAWARAIFERDSYGLVSIAECLSEGHPWSEPVVAFFNVVAPFEPSLNAASRDALAFWRNRASKRRA